MRKEEFMSQFGASVLAEDKIMLASAAWDAATPKWLPMECAPKGHPYQACFILCYVEQDGGGFYIVMFYNHELAGWQSSVDLGVHTPLCWMPIIKIDGHD